MELVEKLRSRLNTEPLPGEEAHLLMMPKLTTGSRIRFNNPDNPKNGAVLLMLYMKEGQYYFPLIQRPTYEGVHSGQIAFPGGKWEKTDKDLIETALRESEEEIGVNPKNIEILGNLSEFFVAASNHMILPVVGFYHGKPEFVPDHFEVDEVIEASVEVLLKEEYIKEKEITTSLGYTLRSPYFDVEQRVVWGATAMMLSEFAEILKKL